MLNRWEGIGRLGRDVEMRYLSDGTAVASFSVACDEKWKDRSGEEQKRTEWVKCVAFDKLAEICGKYLTKGQLVYVAGRLTTREYEKNGEKRFMTEIKLTDMKMLGGKADEREPGNSATAAQRSGGGAATEPHSSDMTDDDVPF
ncbi:MAG: single-stranded DNA-binding protein [Desulfurellales bacterium]|nr:MAG: single-stranded DNA-binding protein [Desulfurellales bacterium]